MLTSPSFLGECPHAGPRIFRSITAPDAVTWDDVNALLGSGLVDYPRIRIANAGNDYAKGFSGFVRYSCSDTGERQARIVPGVLNKALRQGSSVIIDQCDAYLPKIKALVRHISDTLSCQAWANLYISPRGSSGFGCHFDDHDILAFQLFGVKRWQVFPPTYQAPDRGDKSFHFPAPDGKPSADYELNAGDALYLPLGYWHDVETVSDVSLHVTVGMDFARRLDILKEIAGELAKDGFFRDKINAKNAPSEARELKRRLSELLSAIDMEHVVRKVREEHAPTAPNFTLPRF